MASETEKAVGLKVCELYGGDPANADWHSAEGLARIMEEMTSNNLGMAREVAMLKLNATASAEAMRERCAAYLRHASHVRAKAGPHAKDEELCPACQAAVALAGASVAVAALPLPGEATTPNDHTTTTE